MVHIKATTRLIPSALSETFMGEMALLSAPLLLLFGLLAPLTLLFGSFLPSPLLFGSFPPSPLLFRLSLTEVSSISGEEDAVGVK